jgi:2-oxoisovalerate dehydrogenase E2 component (dihydrolipoyl transacylase)
MTVQRFCLPDVGEGLLEAEILAWHVAVGETVEQDQTIVEIETAKSVVELPSPWAGSVAALVVEPGETVSVGTPIIVIDVRSDAREAASEPRPSVLVGYGPVEGATKRRPRKPVAEVAVTSGSPVTARAGAIPRRAKPPLRKFARDLGVDLATVAGTGADNTVTREDVRRHAAAGRSADGASSQPAVPTASAPATPTGETRIPVRGIRRVTAAAMVSSAFTAPHVTEFLTVDVSRTVRLIGKLRRENTFDGAKVTLLLLVAYALLAAVREFPDINASWDDDANEIVLHHQVNLGIAAATPRGLLVPNIKDAGSQSMLELAESLTNLVRIAREGRTSPEEMARGTITITNIGVFGVDAGTPILNPGEAAILCVGAVREMPWAHKGKIALRWTTQLAMSFDHRLVDGELGSRVLARVGKILEDPEWELLLLS